MIAIALVMVAGATALAAPPDRVLLADPDPELLHAVEVSLEPWHLAVVVDRAAPKDDATAHDRAEVTAARFVVWRQGDQLVVFDRDRDASERRPARAGAFDPVTAAAAAATVKTMMRLPPPPAEEPAATATASPPPPVIHATAESTGTIEVRIEAGASARVGGGSDPGLGGRGELAAMLRPSSRHGWRVGVRGDLGTSTSIDRASFQGTWSDWAVLAAASWTLARGPWELEPWVGAGVARGTLDGTEASAARTEHATLAALRGGVYGRRRFGAFTAGIDLALAAAPGAPTYTKTTSGMGTPSIYEASQFSVVIGLALAADLGR